MDVSQGSDILDGQAKRLEERDLLRVAAPAAAAENELADFRDDVVVADRALPLGEEEITGFVERRFAAVDEEAGALHRLGVELA